MESLQRLGLHVVSFYRFLSHRNGKDSFHLKRCSEAQNNNKSLSIVLCVFAMKKQRSLSVKEDLLFSEESKKTTTQGSEASKEKKTDFSSESMMEFPFD
jgi:hypothetical protein